MSQEDGISKEVSPTVPEVPEVPISQGSKDSDPMSDPMSQDDGMSQDPTSPMDPDPKEDSPCPCSPKTLVITL